MSVFRSMYDGIRKRVSVDFVDDNGDPSVGMTEQHHKESCDINNILKKYDKTGLITHVNNSVANYGDFTTVNEYQESLNMVISAQNAFNELPSDVRKRFGNDPGAFFEFATDPANQSEMVKLGLAVAPVVAPTVETEV